MDNTIDNKLSEELYILKFFAICSAIMAHSSYLEVSNAVDVYFLGRFARFGVFTFFFLSGYFFRHESFSVFIKKNTINLVIPWLFLGTCVHFGSMLLNEHRINSDNFFNYIIGNGSTLYFCTELILLKCLFQAFTHNKNSIDCRKRMTLICVICIVCTLISLFFTALGWLPQNYDSSKSIYEYVNPYLNIFNWIGIFAGGVLTRQFHGFEYLNKTNKKIKVSIAIIAMCVILVGIFDTGCSYFSFLGIYVEFSIFILIFLLVDYWHQNLNRKIVIFAGKNTYPLFLLHYPVLAILMHGAQLRSSFILALLRPISCVVILCVVFYLAKYVAKRFHLLTIMKILTGIK